MRMPALSIVTLHRACMGMAALVLGLALTAVSRAQPPSPEVQVITQAKALASNDSSIPDMDLQGLAHLPDDWSANRPQLSGSVWYRARFEAPTAMDQAAPLSLYIERACHNVEVFLNGRPVYHSGRVQEPITRNCPYPQLIPLPAPLLREDGNSLDLRVHGQALHRVAAVERAGGLSALRVGPQSLLQPEHDRALFMQVTLVQITSGALCVLGIVLLVLGWPMRREGHEWVLGWLMLGWSALSARLWWREPPVEHAIVEFVAISGLSLLTALAAVFLLRYAKWHFKPIEVGLLFQCLLMPLTLLLAGPNRLNFMASIWTFVLSIEVFIAMGLYMVLSWPQRRAEFWAVSPVLALVAILLMVEMATQRRLIDPPSYDVTQMGVSTALLVLGLWVLAQYSRNAQAAAAASPGQRVLVEKQQLETRVAELDTQRERALGELNALRADYQKAMERKPAPPNAPALAGENDRQQALLADARLEQVTAQERKRIAADLHDDLGAKLLTIVHTSESDQISTLAREALEEMRLSVRGLSGKPMRLADALADWRAETVARLSQANIEIDWRGPTEETEQRLAARSFVQTTRILREAVSNVIKHSGASQCKVRCGIREGEFGLVIQDNGNGISVDMDGKLDRGHGMAGMKNRAKQMQGQCLVESGPGYGTVIRLTLPL